MKEELSVEITIYTYLVMVALIILVGVLWLNLTLDEVAVCDSLFCD